jgi:hypothetical protein
MKKYNIKEILNINSKNKIKYSSNMINLAEKT